MIRWHYRYDKLRIGEMRDPSPHKPGENDRKTEIFPREHSGTLMLVELKLYADIMG